MALNNPNAWNIIGQGLKGTFNDWISGKNNVSPADMLLPGSTFLWNMTDPTGSGAATTAYQRQIQLDNMQREYNAGEAEKQRNWEEMMSSTAIQRQVADAKAAGINPVALFGSGASGAGADVPSGSSAQSSAGNATIANNKITAAAGVVALFLRMILTKGK